MGATKYRTRLLELVAVLVLCGCTLHPPPAALRVTPTPAAVSPQQNLVGVWEMAGWDYSMHFVADGTVVRNIEGQDIAGTYAISPDGKRLKIDYADGTVLDTAFVLTGDMLVLALDDPTRTTSEPITLMRS